MRALALAINLSRVYDWSFPKHARVRESRSVIACGADVGNGINFERACRVKGVHTAPRKVF